MVTKEEYNKLFPMSDKKESSAENLDDLAKNAVKHDAEKCKEEPSKAGKRDKTKAKNEPVLVNPKKSHSRASASKQRFPNSILRMVGKIPKKHNGFYMVDPFPRMNRIIKGWTFYDMKSVNDKNIIVTKDKKEMLTPVPRVLIFPNFIGQALIVGKKSDLKTSVPIVEHTVGERLVTYYLDENRRGEVRTKTLFAEDFYIYYAIVNKESCVIYSKDELEDGKVYWMKALQIPTTDMSEGIKQISNNYFSIATAEDIENFTSVAKKKFNRMSDFCPVWDIDKKIATYDEVESFIITSACFYMETSIPAINLVMCGETGGKKTAWFDSWQLIFGDNYAVSQSSTAKGLIVSFYGDKPRAGMIFRARYIAMVDELFRRYLLDMRTVGKTGLVSIIRAGMSELMNLLEHKIFPYPSGKGDINLALKTSFMATDNAIYKKTLPKVWRRDPACLKRLCWLMISKETANRGNEMQTHDISEIVPSLLERWKSQKLFISFSDYAKFARYAREQIALEQITPEDNAMVNSLLNQVQAKYSSTMYLGANARALLKCHRFFSKCVKDVPPYETIFWRLADDSAEILKPHIKWQDDVGDGEI